MEDLTPIERQNIEYFNKNLIADAYIKELHKEIKFLKNIIHNMNNDLIKVESLLSKEIKKTEESSILEQVSYLRDRVTTLSGKKEELRKENWELKKLLKQLKKKL